jgi:hypothetical protein
MAFGRNPIAKSNAGPPHTNSLRRPREGGAPLSFAKRAKNSGIPSFAGMTRLTG